MKHFRDFQQPNRPLVPIGITCPGCSRTHDLGKLPKRCGEANRMNASTGPSEDEIIWYGFYLSGVMTTVCIAVAEVISGRTFLLTLQGEFGDYQWWRPCP